MRAVVHWCARHDLALIGAAAGLALATSTVLVGPHTTWATPDQRGAWLFRHGAFAKAASHFTDPVWRGVALMRAGRFKEAAESFGASNSAEAAYDRGNALVMLGQYVDAVRQFDRAIALRPDWDDARANRALALARAESFAKLQGEEADKQGAAVKEAYRHDRPRGSEDEKAPAAAEMSDAAIHALWLRRIQTRPADFLRARFAFQLQQAQGKAAGE